MKNKIISKRNIISSLKQSVSTDNFYVFFDLFNFKNVYYRGNSHQEKRFVSLLFNKQYYSFEEASIEPYLYTHPKNSKLLSITELMDFFFLSLPEETQEQLFDDYCLITWNTTFLDYFWEDLLNKTETDTFKYLFGELFSFSNFYQDGSNNIHVDILQNSSIEKSTYFIVTDPKFSTILLYEHSTKKNISFYSTILSEIQNHFSTIEITFPPYLFQTNSEHILTSIIRPILENDYKKSNDYKIRTIFTDQNQQI